MARAGPSALVARGADALPFAHMGHVRGIGALGIAIGVLATSLLLPRGRATARAPRSLPTAEIRTPGPTAVVDGLVHVGITIGAPGAPSFGFRLEVVPADRPDRRIPLGALTDVPCDPGSPATGAGVLFGATWDTHDVPDGAYTLRLRVRNAFGDVRETLLPIRVEHPQVEERPSPYRHWDGSENESALA